MNAIETVRLTKHYPRGGARGRFGQGSGEPVRALEEVTLAVRPGEIFGFLGPNGAGKSTCIRLLLGFLHPTAGSARVLGLDTETDSVAIRARVGYLPGGIALYDAMTGAALLDYLAALYDRPPALRKRLLDGLELSFADLARPVRDYSRGMRQKLGIVQALQHDPELAILDEPSEGLDPLMQREFLALVAEARSAGRTVFLSSHNLTEVERSCDRVAIIREGRLVKVATVAALVGDHTRSINLLLVRPAPDGTFVLPGVTVLSSTGQDVHLLVRGDVNPLLHRLAELQVRDIAISTPDVEDLFFRYSDGSVAGSEGRTAGLDGRTAGPDDGVPATPGLDARETPR